MRLFVIALSTILLLAACSGDSPAAPTTTPTAPVAATGAVDITFPQSGAVIYAESVTISGTALIDPAIEQFRLQIITPSDEILSDTVVDVSSDGSWSTEIIHGYTGDPIETLIMALPIDESLTGDYDIESVVISSIDNRPDGVFGMIMAPANDSSVGGDEIQVSGTASGLFEGTLLVTLEQPDGTPITEEVLTVFNPGIIDEVIWSADIETAGFTGSAVIRIHYQDAATGDDVTLDSVDITLTTTAG